MVDTNVFIYDLDKHSLHYQIASSFLSDSHYQLFTTSKCVSEYFAVTSKLRVHFDLVMSNYDKFKKYTQILYPNPESLYFFESLIEKYQPVGNKIYDIEIVSVMLANQLVEIATFNNKDFATIKEISLLKL